MANSGISEKKNFETDISIADLIAAPLTAAAEAQLNLARSTVEFIHSVGIQKDSTGRETARNLSFTVQAPAKEGGSMNELSIQAPLLAIVPIPNLAVEEVCIDFQMEVTSTSKVQTQVEQQEELSSHVAVCGKVSSSAAQTRDSNQSAKYQIQVKARKQEPPEGLSRLLDVLAATVQGQ